MSLWSAMVVNIQAHGSGGCWLPIPLPAWTAARDADWSTLGPRLVHEVRNASGWFRSQCSPVYAYACTCLVDQVVICGCRAVPAAD
jgi:hypothetical protein